MLKFKPFNVKVSDINSPLFLLLLSVAGTSFPALVTSVELNQHLCASCDEISVFGSATNTSISLPTYDEIGVLPMYIVFNDQS